MKGQYERTLNLKDKLTDIIYIITLYIMNKRVGDVYLHVENTFLQMMKYDITGLNTVF